MVVVGVGGVLAAAFVLSDAVFADSFPAGWPAAAGFSLPKAFSPAAAGFGASVEEAPGGLTVLPELTPEVEWPPVVAALASGSWPEGGVLGRPDGACAKAQITGARDKRPINSVVRLTRNMLAPAKGELKRQLCSQRRLDAET
jgi:hypothetical protein